MKTRVMMAALLIAMGSISAFAQSGSVTGNTASKRPASTAGRTNSTDQSNGSGNPSMGSGSTGKLSGGKASGQGSAKHGDKASGKTVNQQAAGVPNKGSAAQLRTGQTSSDKP